MLKMLMAGIRGAGRLFSDEWRRESDGEKPFRRGATRSCRAVLPAVCNLLLAVVMLNPFAVRAQTTAIVASGLWNVVSSLSGCNNTNLETFNLTYANGAYSATHVDITGISPVDCTSSGPHTCTASGFYLSGQDLLSVSQFGEMLTSFGRSCWAGPATSMSLSFLSPDSVLVTGFDSGRSLSVQMTRAASATVDMTGTWTATLNGTIFKGDSWEGQTTWLTLTIVQSGSNVSVTSGYSDTLGRSGSWAGTWSISGNTMDAWYSIDPDPACASRTFTHTITVTSTAPDQMTDTFTAPASGSCPAQSASVVYTKQAAPAPTSYALDVTATGSGYGSVSSSPAGISCYVPEPGTYYLVAPDCTESYASGTSVTLTATPATGSYFAGWSGACSGTGSCAVTMSAAKNVTATFKPVPFVANTTSIITPTSATITTNIAFNAPDVGKSGAVYVTGWVPVKGLGALGILTAPMNHALSVTTTRDNPHLGGAVNSRQETLGTLLAATDPTTFVLIQRTPSGWALVVNGQLIPYLTGVLGDSLAAQSILNNTNPSNLLGAQFCVGYGISDTEMILSGRMLPVAIIPDANSTAATNGSCNVTDIVVEFYNTNLDHYFITADANEAAQIDNGSAGPGWSRTGNSFRSGGDTSVCRFYGSQSPGPNSHFYTVDAGECAYLKQLQASTPDTEKRWNFESLDFVSTPATNQTCPSGTTPVYRAYNNGFSRGVDSNHRITSSATAIQEVVNRGWSNEGVVMCAPN